MKKRIILNIAISLDGYIATENDDVEWLNEAVQNDKVDLDLFMDNFMESISVIVMGKKSYEVTKNFGALSKQFPGKKIFVFSHQEINDRDVIAINEPINTFVKNIHKNIWLFGGAQMVKSFLEANLITDIKLTICPKTIGKGKKLFLPINNQQTWILKNQKQYNNFITLHYIKKGETYEN